MRQGSRAARPTVVVYVAQTGNASSMAGFAVSKAVGGAVIRNRVKRRLRAIMADAVGTLPAGTSVVVRAQAAAATASYGDLRRDVTNALARALEVGNARAAGARA